VSTLADRVATVQERIARAAARAGRASDSVRLVAVAKRHPATAVREAHALGLRAFGENYAQELVAKAAELGPLAGIEWHMIGHLQTNKARLVAPVVAMVHTIDSAHIATELAKRASRAGRHIDALIEVNVAEDPSKTGCAPDDLAAIIDAVRVSAAGALELRGLMTMPPYSDDADATRPFFAKLHELRERHGGQRALPELSMGMSHDLEAAIAEGATIVRVGTAIFGEREAP
jgi:pyridoxal phosphate enzyme (YggS family)